MACRSNHRYVGMCRSLDHADTGVPMKTGFSTKPELNAVNREKRIEPQQRCRAHRLALCTTLLPMLMVIFGCGGDTDSASTRDPITARPAPINQQTDNSIQKTSDGTGVKSAPDSSRDSTNAPPAAPEDTANLVSETSGWKVLFRASDPNLWNTSSDGESSFSVTLDNFADETRYDGSECGAWIHAKPPSLLWPERIYSKLRNSTMEFSGTEQANALRVPARLIASSASTARH